MDQPLVSILTPVYNGEAFLAECIESVLSQTYRHWEYVIVNNCSTDRTLEIAQSYAARDARIRVVCNTEFVNADANHNNAFRQISAQSRYTKVVSADDWLHADCVEKMVAAALARPSVGLVGCYQRSGPRVLWSTMPAGLEFLAGREAARMALLKGIHIFGPPTACLYRSDLVRKRPSFFPHTRPHADTSVCYECMRDTDFGFVHEILCEERLHVGQQSSKLAGLLAGDLAYIEDLLVYGPVFLAEDELRARQQELLDGYYARLGRSLLRAKGVRFWEYQKDRLQEIGCPINWKHVATAALAEAWRELRHPLVAVRRASNGMH